MSPTITSAERHDARALAAIGIGVLLFQLCRDRLHIGQRGLHRDAILEPRYSVESCGSFAEVTLELAA